MVFLPGNYVVNPILKESAYEIDRLLQDIIVDRNDYTLTVFELTEEQSQIYVMGRLRGGICRH